MKKIFSFITVFFLLGAFLIPACEDTDNSTTSVDELINRSWSLTLFAAPGDNATLIPGTRITILFNADNSVEGSAGCNSYFASYAADNDGTLSISHIGSTEMYCSSPEGVVDQEAAYLNKLATVSSFQISYNQLTLFTVSGGHYLKYSAVATGD